MRRIFLLVLAAQLWACKKESSDEPPAPPAAPPTSPTTAAPPKEEGPDWQKAFQHTVRYDSTNKAIVVDVKIEPGFHAYTVGETIGKPMQLALDEASTYALGEVQYPAGTTKDLPIGKSVIVEGEAKIVGPIQKKPGPSADQATGTFRWQVCTDEACDRPRTKPFAVEVPVSN
jgi:hypothetical protein